MTVQQMIGRIDPASRSDWILPADVARAAGAESLQGKRVGVVGGGLTGLTSAFILAGMGVHVDLFEAAGRFGGRVLTLRNGDRLPGDPSRVMTLPGDQFVEAGATRIHPHMVTMEYLRMLDVPVAPIVTRNDDALIHLADSSGSKVLRQRDWWQEVRRLAIRPDLAELYLHLLADSAEDQAPHRTRRALNALSDVGDPMAPSAPGCEPLASSLLVDSAPARALLADLSALKSTTLFRIVGGSDLMVERLAEQIPPAQRHLDHRLTSVVTTGDRVRLGFATPEGERHETYDHVVLTLPPHQLAEVVEDFPDDVRVALRAPEPRPAVKVFLTYAQRWWERELGIFGGTSYPASLIDRLWYPSTAWHATGGTLTAYSLKDNASQLDAMDEETRHELIVDRIAELHPGIPAAAEPVAVQSVSWSQVPYIHGAWVNWPGYYDLPVFQRLHQGMGRVQFAGDWLNPLTAWMAGAFSSAGEALLRTIQNACERR
ncbi:FAD-dependent oxidoreductase [Kitasatospora sp. NPDC048545]|uniref:flavin monoamine oxidase family protein n=1 Tax=Kitasatospora sp. NPDC048545 TaxID=3157208 RepID=UPI0033F222D8